MEQGLRRPPLESERLKLRRMQLDDAEHFSRLLGSDEEAVMRMSRMPWPCTVEAAKDWIELRIRPGGHLFAVLLKRDETFIGCMGFHGPLAEVGFGYWIARPYWNRGYATEAAALVLAFARERGVRRVTADTFMENPASARVLEKAGFLCEGTLRRDFPERGGIKEVRVHTLELASGKQAFCNRRR
jgi:RimJ/RimL family protein N-acetyltransferase